ncbi:MAG: DUF6756 family protein [Holophagaceae bacterium]
MYHPATWIRESMAHGGAAGLGLKELPPIQGEEVLRDFLKRFVDDADRTWWWEGLKGLEKRMESPESAGILPALVGVPEDSEAILITTPDDGEPITLFEGRFANLCRLIDDCPYFEFVIVSRQLDWALLESHHNEVLLARNSGLKG